MDSKEDYKSDSKYDDKDTDIIHDSKDNYEPIPPQINITSININSNEEWINIDSPLDLNIIFELDRDAIASYWLIQFLVDSSHKRIIKILGKTNIDDYPEGESEMNFYIDSIDVSGIPPSTLTNSGLLMAILMVDGEEIASVNMVVNVAARDGVIQRQIISPLD